MTKQASQIIDGRRNAIAQPARQAVSDVDTAGHGKCDTKIGGIANTQRRSLRAYFALPINHNLESIMIKHALFVRLDARQRMEAEDA